MSDNGLILFANLMMDHLYAFVVCAFDIFNEWLLNMVPVNLVGIDENDFACDAWFTFQLWTRLYKSANLKWRSYGAESGNDWGEDCQQTASFATSTTKLTNRHNEWIIRFITDERSLWKSSIKNLCSKTVSHILWRNYGHLLLHNLFNGNGIRPEIKMQITRKFTFIIKVRLGSEMNCQTSTHTYMHMNGHESANFVGNMGNMIIYRNEIAYERPLQPFLTFGRKKSFIVPEHGMQCAVP